MTAWIFNRLADLINWISTGPAPHPCSCVKKQHLNWTEIVVVDPHCLAHSGKQVTK